jgi:hypothetical protein
MYPIKIQQTNQMIIPVIIEVCDIFLLFVEDKDNLKKYACPKGV